MSRQVGRHGRLLIMTIPWPHSFYAVEVLQRQDPFLHLHTFSPQRQAPFLYSHISAPASRSFSSFAYLRSQRQDPFLHSHLHSGPFPNKMPRSMKVIKIVRHSGTPSLWPPGLALDLGPRLRFRLSHKLPADSLRQQQELRKFSRLNWGGGPSKLRRNFQVTHLYHSTQRSVC